jgi:hypothetical protein
MKTKTYMKPTNESDLAYLRGLAYTVRLREPSKFSRDISASLSAIIAVLMAMFPEKADHVQRDVFQAYMEAHPEAR